ncbi:MAG: hypothetical protein H7256_11625 [Bdellovibrio sp.]|nr:hypothetical protein [Bdellovibrio sp.]
MKQEEKNIEVLASIGDQRMGLGRITIREFSANQRLVNAFKKLLLFWLAAAFSVLIPALHFLLVPLFFILGIVAFSKTIKLNGKVIKGQTECPYCKSSVKISPTLLAWPLKEICRQCGRAIRINPKDK